MSLVSEVFISVWYLEWFVEGKSIAGRRLCDCVCYAYF